MIEALAMVKGELSAAGFRIIVRHVTNVAQASATIDAVVAQDKSTAVVVVKRRPSENAEVETLEFWIYEPWGRETTTVRSRIDTSEPSLSARRGAVQAVEVLRAVLAQRGIDPKVGTETQSLHEVDADPESAPRDQQARSGLVRIGAGLALWNGFDGLGSSLTPIAALAVALPGLLPTRLFALDLRASAAGLGWDTELTFMEGTVQVRQALLTGELVMRLWPHALVQPLFSLCGGGYAVSVEAEAEAPYIARSPHTWSGLFGAGAGLMVAVSTHFAVSLETQLLAATAPSDVSVAGRVEAVAGAPILLTSAQLAGGF